MGGKNMECFDYTIYGEGDTAGNPIVRRRCYCNTTGCLQQIGSYLLSPKLLGYIPRKIENQEREEQALRYLYGLT